MATTIDTMQTLERRYIDLGHTATGPQDYDDLIVDMETALALTRSQLAELEPRIIDAELAEREADALYHEVLGQKVKLNAALIRSQGNESRYAKVAAEEDAVQEAFDVADRELRSAKVRLTGLMRQRTMLRQNESMLSMRLGQSMAAREKRELVTTQGSGGLRLLAELRSKLKV